MKRIVVLGAGESGAGAAVLAKKEGFDVFVSDMSKIAPNYKQMLDDHQIAWEEGQHTESLILNADEIIKSPGIPETAPMVRKAVEKGIGIISENINWLGQSGTAKAVIIIALLWRWTGYNMVFFLAGLQNIEYSVYEAANIDGASGWKTFWHITVPLLRPVIVMTGIMSINGTLQLFDESVNLTNGGPANSTITMSHYIYNNALGQGVANFGYASALSFIVFILVAILAFINLKVGDTRD